MAVDPVDEPDSPEEAHRAQRASKRATLQVADVASERASLRAAMDPANQSLGEALRLSYRVLQIAIAGLVVTFLFSGFQSVPEGVTGIRTVFGRVVGEGDGQVVTPGLQPFWPTPIGELVTLSQRQTFEVREAFWPQRALNDVTMEAATDAASADDPIQPGRDGALLTADGDLAHAQFAAEWTVVDPVAMLRLVDPERAATLMRALLRRAAISTVAELTLPEFLEQREPPALTIRQRMQATLRSMDAGIEVVSVTILERTAPFAVRGALRRVQTAREEMKTNVERARQDANTRLVGVAGPQFNEILGMIHEYEMLLTKGDAATSDALLRRIGERFEQSDIGGEAARIIAQARSKQTSVTAALAQEARRVGSLAASYRENPRQLIQQLWLDAVRQVVNSEEVEVFSVPDNLGRYVLRVRSSPDTMQTRRDAELERKKAAAAAIGADLPSFQLGSRLITPDAPGRRLDKSGTKAFGKD